MNSWQCLHLFASRFQHMATRVWPSVRREFERALAFLPPCVARPDRTWDDVVHACDASPSGFGVHERTEPALGQSFFVCSLPQSEKQVVHDVLLSGCWGYLRKNLTTCVAKSSCHGPSSTSPKVRSCLTLSVSPGRAPIGGPGPHLAAHARLLQAIQFSHSPCVACHTQGCY